MICLLIECTLLLATRRRVLPIITYCIVLTAEERQTLEAIAAKGNTKARKTINALILLNGDKGEGLKQPRTNEEIAEVLRIHSKTV